MMAEVGDERAFCWKRLSAGTRRTKGVVVLVVEAALVSFALALEGVVRSIITVGDGDVVEGNGEYTDDEDEADTKEEQEQDDVMDDDDDEEELVAESGGGAGGGDVGTTAKGPVVVVVVVGVGNSKQRCWYC
eukprot:GEZU01020799.1.p2 GENE.GEZU01020799.1~~GEZU01020799.1.p2  ORF type:complete len:132 (+),score=13.81 GEZU01020799.1:155-550(+)